MEKMNLDRVKQQIAAIEAREEDDEWFVVPARYPYTYAYDYMSNHVVRFGRYISYSGWHPSRADCAAALKDHPDKEEICKALADAYLREHRIIWKGNKPDDDDR